MVVGHAAHHTRCNHGGHGGHGPWRRGGTDAETNALHTEAALAIVLAKDGAGVQLRISAPRTVGADPLMRADATTVALHAVVRIF